MKDCSVQDCDRKYRSSGYCNMHYLRLRKHSDLGPAGEVKFTTELAPENIVSRILERCVERESGCVEWQGPALHSGYGYISWDKRTWVVHRAMWTAQVGPIPTDDDWVIDHLCRNRRCVNVRHLEVVTRIENTLRGGGLAIAQGRNKQRNKIRCRNGHDRSTENTRITSAGDRVCVQCERENWARNKTAVSVLRRATYKKARDAGMSSREASAVANRVRSAGPQMQERCAPDAVG